MSQAATATAAAAAAAAEKHATSIWVERYRPKSLKDVSHQSEVVATLQNAVTMNRPLPHLLLYGPPGSGKTSVALALCRQLWHPSQWRRRVLELNASDERGISVVRDKIKHFASLSVGKGSGAAASKKSFFQKKADADDESSSKMDVDGEKGGEQKYPNPPFKIIILDEADTVTPDAQAALRRIIEAHSRITRFILICNYVTRIIEPLASRCAKFRFQPLPPASMKDRLTSIATSEGCSPAEMDLLDDILDHANGDMRRAVTTLQSVHSLARGGDVVITESAIAEIVGVPPKNVVDDLWNKGLAQQPDQKSGGGPSFDVMQAAVDDITAEGYSAQLLLSAMLPKVTADKVLTERAKAEICIRMAEAEKNMIEGADEYLQLMTVCTLAIQWFETSRRQHAKNNN